jgi:hypothetical protein
MWRCKEVIGRESEVWWLVAWLEMEEENFLGCIDED